MATITVDLLARTGSFETDIKRASRESQRAAKQMQEDFKRAGAAIGVALAAGVTAMAAITKQAINTGDEFAKMSQKVGVSVESLSRLGYAAGQSGVELGQLQSGLVKLAKNASDAAQETGTAVQGFQALGIAVKNTDGSLKNTDVLLKEIATKFAGYEDGANKTALAVNLFGRAGAELIPLLNEGADGIGALEERARALGLEISTNTAKESELFNDLLEDMGNLAKGLGNDIAAGLLPMLNSLAGEFVDNGMKAREAGNGNTFFADSIKGVITGAIVAKNTIEALTNGIAGMIDVATASATAARQLATFANPAAALSEALQGNQVLAPAQILANFRREAEGAFMNASVGIADSIKDINAAFAAMKAPADDANASIEGTGEAAGKAAPALLDLAKESANAAKAQKEMEKAFKEALRAQDEAVRGVLELVDAYEREEEARRESQSQYDLSIADLESEIRVLGLSGTARQQAIILLDAERMARQQTAVSVEEATERYQELLTTLAAAQEIEAAAREFESIWLNAADSVGDALTTALFDGAESGADAIKDVMKNLARDLVRFWLQQKIIIPLQQQLMGGGAGGGLGSLFGGASGGAGGLGGLSSLFGGGNAPSAALGGGPPSNLAGAGGFMQGAASYAGVVIGAYNVYDNFQNGAGGAEGALSGAASGAAAGMVFGPWGAAIGAIIGGLAGLFGGAKDPDLRLGGVGVTRKPEETFETAFGMQQIGVRGGTSSFDMQNLVIDFDEQLAAVVNTFSNGAEQMTAIGAALDVWSIDLEGSAITAENVLGSRFNAILSTFDADVQAFVGTAGDMEERLARFADAAFIDAAVNSTKPLIDNFADLAAILDANQAEGEALQQTYSRIGASTAMFEAALGDVGVSLDMTRVEFVQFATDITDAAGGLEAASNLWAAYFDTFYTAEERTAAALASAQARAETEFADIGRSFGDFTGEGGAAAFRSAIEEVFATGSAEAIVQWLEAASALGIVLDLQGQVTTATEEVVEALQFNVEAALEYADTVQGINRQLYELSGATEFRQSLAAVQEQYMANVATLTAQAQAAGVSAARTEDLTAAMQLQVRQVAQLERQLTEAAQAQADTLGYSPLGIINEQIASLQAEENAAAESTRNLQDSISEMGRIASDVAAAMLGDMGPLSGTAKADYALRALQDGAISLDAALNAGRDVFASGADFNQFFNEAVAIAGNRQEDTPQNVGQTVSVAMRDLLAHQAELEAQANQAGRTLQAQELAAMVADLSYIRGQSPEEVLSSLGIDLDRFIADLGVSDAEGFDAFITQLQTDQMAAQEWFATNVTADGLLIAETLNAIFNAGVDPLLTPIPEPEKPYGEEPIVGNEKSAREEMREENKLLREEVAQLRDITRQLLTRVASNTGTTAVAAKDQVQIGQRDSMRNDQGRSRAVRRRETVS